MAISLSGCLCGATPAADGRLAPCQWLAGWLKPTAVVGGKTKDGYDNIVERPYVGIVLYCGWIMLLNGFESEFSI